MQRPQAACNFRGAVAQAQRQFRSNLSVCFDFFNLKPNVVYIIYFVIICCTGYRLLFQKCS